MNSPNIFYCSDQGVSPFWKGVLWAANAAKMGYQWKIGNGKKVKFWCDHWFGETSLAVQFWDLYILCNEQNATVSEVKEDNLIKLTFRRCFDQQLLLRWFDLVSIVETIQLNGEEDNILWKFESKGVFSVRSMYAVINFRGITPTHVHALWKIKVPPKIHFFLWLVSHNKLLTRDNLVKRQRVDDLSCLFCSENESCCHLLFDCVIANVVWTHVSRMTGKNVVPASFTRIANLWLGENSNKVVNIVHATCMWALWTIRNGLCFNGDIWLGMQAVWRKVAYSLSQWQILLSGDAKTLMARYVEELGALARSPPCLTWPDPE